MWQIQSVLLSFGLSCFPHDARKEVLDFTPFCVHQDVVGAVPGIDWDLVQSVEKYKASLEVPSDVLPAKFFTLHLPNALDTKYWPLMPGSSLRKL